jgi:hypothetical protein
MNEINLTVPKRYSEMSFEQTKYVCLLLSGNETEEAIWTKCFIRFTGIKPLTADENSYYFVQKSTKKLFSLAYEEVNYFSKMLKFTTRDYTGIKPISTIKGCRSCDQLLRDIDFGVYLEIENFYQAYLFTKEDKYIGRLMAALYTKKGKRKPNFEKCTPTEKLWTIMWIVGIKSYFSRKFSYLFERATPTEQGEEPTAPDMYSIIQNQVRALTDGDITKREKVLKSNTWDALEELNNKIREVKQMVNSKL